MPKLKPHKGLRQRVKVSAKKKVTYKRRGTGHLLSGKSGRRKQWLRRSGTLTGRLADRIVRMLTLD